MKKSRSETKKESKLRLNAIDALIIILLILCITAVALRYTVLNDLFTKRDLTEYEITFTATGLSYAQCNALVDATNSEDESKTWIYLSDGVTKLGNLSRSDDTTKQERDLISMLDENGKKINVGYDPEEEDKYVEWTFTSKIICLGKGDIKNGGEFLLNGNYYIAPNSKLNVYTGICDFEITVLNIEPVTVQD